MPCAGPDYSCNSLINLRSPLGEARLGDANSSAHDRLQPAPFARLYSWICEAFVHRRQRCALCALDARLLADIGIAQPDAAREVRKPFWK